MTEMEEIRSIPIVDAARSLGLEVNKYNKSICFMHRENHPSLCFDTKRNYFHCFGCNSKGDIIKLVMDYLNMNFPEAKKYLTERFLYNNSAVKVEKPADYKSNYCDKNSFRIEIPEERLKKNIEIYEALMDHSIDLVNRTMLHGRAKEYLFSRKLTGQILLRFNIFSIREYLSANNFLKENYSYDDLNNSGIISEKGNLIFFKHIIIFPYFKNGRLIYMRGRTFEQETDQPKYLGLKQVSGKQFYNIDITNRMKPHEEIYICEGEIDCITLNMIGKKAIAIPGVNNIPPLSEWKKISHLNLKIIFDNDLAGKKAQEEIKSISESLHISCTFVNIKSKDINESLNKE